MADMITLTQLTTVVEIVKNYFTQLLSDITATTTAALEEIEQRLGKIENAGNNAVDPATIEDIKTQLQTLREHAILDNEYMEN